jgi:hypothetical protein
MEEWLETHELELAIVERQAEAGVPDASAGGAIVTGAPR